MTGNRCFSAPPTDNYSVGDNIELKDIQYDLYYSSYYKGHNDDRLTPSRFMFDGQGSFWASEHNDFILRAFSEKKTGVEMIDLDYPSSDLCREFSGKSRTTTPVGDKPMVQPDMLQNTTNSTTMLIPIPASSIYKPETNPVIEEIKGFSETAGIDTSLDTKSLCVTVCKDQDGSRFIQSKLEMWSSEQISFFFLQICDSSLDLSTNLFGNYVIQKIIPYLREDEAFKLIVQFFGQIVGLSLHVYGCRVIQKLIDNLDDIKFIVSELEDHILELIASPNGNHVIQKCIDKNIEKTFLLKEFENSSVELAQQRYGCRVLQRLFEACDEKETWNIYIKILDNIGVLINDKYGNYVIQHLIQTENRKRSEIFAYIIENSFELSKYKFSSNVIEKCVNNSTKEQLGSFLSRFLAQDDGRRPNLFYMCVDLYANYVVQRFFDIADSEIKAKAKTAIKPFLKEMKAIPFTKHILTRLS